MDPLAKAYMSIFEESCDSSGVVKSTTSQVGKTFGDKQSETMAKKTAPNSSDENVDVEEPEESDRELNSDSAESEPKIMKKTNESTNPFDALYNKVLNEEGEFNFSTEEENTLEPSSDMGGMDDSFEDELGSDESEDSEEGETVSFTLDKEMAEKLIEVLSAAIGEGSEDDEVEDIEDMEEEEGNDEGESESNESEENENPFKESVEAEELGHALVDQEKLEKGMTSKSNKEVEGT